jgi:hypothetical protein
VQDHHRRRGHSRSFDGHESREADGGQNLLRGGAVGIERAPGPRNDDEPGQLGDPPRRPPRDQVEKRLGAEDQDQLVTTGLQRLQGVDGVGRSRASQLDVRDGEFRMVRGRQLDHRVTVRRRGQAGHQLVGRRTGGDEDDAIEAQLLEGLVGQEQMAIVNGVERPPEDSRSNQRG